MTNDISEEAKRAIADAPRRRAANRLERDGAYSSDALRRRVRAFAEEKRLQPADIAKLMYKRINTRDVMAFCEKHKVSYDWLLAGDLRGLHRMTQAAKAAPPPEISEGERKEVMGLFCALSPKMQRVALGCMQELIARESSNG